jgi:hypothetical protein
VSYGSKVAVAFRVVILLNLVVTFVSLWLTFDHFNRLAWNVVWVWFDFARQLRPVVAHSTVVGIVQLLLQTPAIALCVVFIAGSNFWSPSRWLMIGFAPIVACVEFMLLVRGMTYLHVVLAPVPLLTAALLFLLLFNPVIKKRFASREEVSGCAR